MAEEAIGLAKSLSWFVDNGPNFMKLSLDPSFEAPEAPVSSSELIRPPEGRQGRKLGRKTKYSVEGELLKNWDKVEVYGTGLKGYYMNGDLMIDLEESSETEEEEIGDEWTDAILRQDIAVSSMVKVRKPGSLSYFGPRKVIIT